MIVFHAVGIKSQRKLRASRRAMCLLQDAVFQTIFSNLTSPVQSVDKITQNKFYICFRISSHLPTAETTDRMSLCHMAKFFLAF